jgi:hypothetical protein
MSHFTTIDTEIRDMDALRAACGELGLEVMADAEARGYGDNRQKGDFVIRLKGPYDIAVFREAEGRFSLMTDWWNGHVEREVGKDYGRLLQLYGVHKATGEARRKGYAVQRKRLQNGAIQLSIGQP